jgi:hypothetical protein
VVAGDVSVSELGGGIPAAGSLNLHNGHDGFAGTGSYFSGLQAGYNKLLPPVCWSAWKPM